MTGASRWALGGTAFTIAGVLIAALLIVGGLFPGSPDKAGPPGAGPLTVVAMGDSTMSGEGAGSYTTRTNGRSGNWCHRSPHAAVHQIRLPGVTESVNLACSGAPSAQVALGRTTQWTEPSQARQLADLTKTHRIAAVVVAVGANDDPRFSRLMSECLNSWLMDDSPCTGALSPSWEQRLDAMAPRVTKALTDIKQVLRDAGYDREDYDLVQLSYASPLAPGIPDRLRNLNGCPFHRQDLKWVRDVAVESLGTRLNEVATHVDARFLDLSDAGTGHEACTGGADPGTEWFNRLTVDWNDLEQAGRASHANHGSFHPNARGHDQFANCLNEFLATDHRAASCLPHPTGGLHVDPELGPR